ncbi:MAG: flagellar M-ring protein FliF C-terminal domain-containing protein [Candidatus Baltobacteraceae bacterium]
MDAAALINRFSSLPPRIRIGVPVALALLVFGIIVALSYTHDNRVALFATPLHADQLTEVQERLAQWNVAFTPSADNVAVEARRRSDLLLRLSLAGVPHSHIDTSNEMLSKVSALTPQSVIDEQTRSGLAADLELALRGLDGVQDASVIIAPAKPAIFADEQSHDATASIRLHIRPGAHLGPTAVAGIRSFVAAGVPGLDARKVMILDDRGVTLTDNGAGGIDETDLQTSLQSALDSAFGAGSAIVRVHVAYDDRAQQIKEVRRIAGSSLPITSDHTEEQYSGADRHYVKATHSDDRGSDVREEQTTLPAGRLARVSVAVVVDQTHGTELYKIRALATAAAGLDARRGDTISVQAVAFHTERPPKTDIWFAAYGAVLTVLPALVIGSIVLFALKLFLKPAAGFITAFAARTSLAQTRKAVAGFAPTQVRGALRNEPPHTAAAIISALPAATAAAVLDLYPPEERTAIIHRMSRAHSSLVPDFESVIANA